MGLPITRPLEHNQNTHLSGTAPLTRMYMAPTSHFELTKSKGVRQPGTATILHYYTATPEHGVGDPRIAGERIVMQQNWYTHTGTV